MKVRPVARYMKLTWRRHWKMEIFTIFQFLLITLLATLVLTSNNKFLMFRWMTEYSDLSYVSAGYESELFQVIEPEDILGQAVQRFAMDPKELVKPLQFRQMEFSVAIDYGLAKYTQVPLSRGHWFEPGGGVQVIVGYSLRDTYSLGQTYSFGLCKMRGEYEQTIQAKVVGYLTSENYTVATGQMESSNFGTFATRENALMFCLESVNTDQVAGDYVYHALVKTPKNIAPDDPNASAFWSLKEQYNYEQQRNQENLILYTYLIAAICVVSILTVCSNLIVNGDKCRRMRAICILCGEPKKGILLSEIIKRVAEWLVALALAFIITFIVDAKSPGTILIPSCCWFGALVTLIIMAVSVLLEAVTVQRLKPLNVLRRD